MASRKKATIHKRPAAKSGKVVALPTTMRPALSVVEGGAPAVVQQMPVPLMPVQAPSFSASSLNIQGTGNDFILLFMRPAPIQGAQGVDGTRAMNVPVAILTVSPQTAKDMAVVIAQAVANHEAMYGKLVTPFTQRQAQSGKKGRKSKK